jgi:hypothetical protein
VYDVTFSENSWSNFAYCLEGLVLIRIQTKNAGSAARKVVFLKRNRKKTFESEKSKMNLKTALDGV